MKRSKQMETAINPDEAYAAMALCILGIPGVGYPSIDDSVRYFSKGTALFETNPKIHTETVVQKTMFDIQKGKAAEIQAAAFLMKRVKDGKK